MSLTRMTCTAHFLDRLMTHASENENAKALTFLGNGADRPIELSYRQLAARATSFAARLQADGLSGRLAVIALPSGVEFVVAFVGCLMAGVVAVPIPALRERDLRTWQRLDAVARDSRPTAVISTPEACERRGGGSGIPVLDRQIRWLTSVSDAVDEGTVRAPTYELRPAFIQYTSGSTADPKGVVITHDNLESNLRAIGKKLRVQRESVVVSWLPMHHDWGLVGAVLAGLYHGNRLVLMSPVHFAQSPVRWLAAITRYRGTHTGAPNFAYELCCRKIRDTDFESLDLGSLEVAGCGAEPIRSRTVHDFCARFSRLGFRSTSFYPCYGMAEATLFVTGADEPREPIMPQLAQQEVFDGETVMIDQPGARPYVNCGSPADGHELRIVDPEVRVTRGEGRVGEVWIRGPSVTPGYWSGGSAQLLLDNATTLDGQGGFLRTGDLGFLRGGELYLAGRLKDVIISNGRKFHPQDIEETVLGLSFDGRIGRVAAFSYDDVEEARLAVVVELQSATTADIAEFPRKVFLAIVRQHEIAPKRVLLVKGGSLPLTTSGKIRRGDTPTMVERCEFDVLAEYVAT